MAFQLADVVPWGRSFDEYVGMFALTAEDLTRRILGIGDGPASFNAQLTRRGGDVISADPLYQFSPEDIRKKIEEVTPVVLEQTRANAASFVWRHVASVDELASLRLSAMNEFLDDYASAASRMRYVDAALPSLPFRSSEFGLALCSHFLFLYGDRHSFEFHLDSLLELCRVAGEARVFPLLGLDGITSRHVEPVKRGLLLRGYRVSQRRVDYEFQRDGNEMLVVRSPEARL